MTEPPPRIHLVEGLNVRECLQQVDSIGEAEKIGTLTQSRHVHTCRAQYPYLLAGRRVALILAAMHRNQRIKSAVAHKSHLAPSGPNIKRAFMVEPAGRVYVGDVAVAIKYEAGHAHSDFVRQRYADRSLQTGRTSPILTEHDFSIYAWALER